MEWATGFVPGYGVDFFHIRTTILYKELKPRPSKVILLCTDRRKHLDAKKISPNFYQVIGNFPRLRSTKYGIQNYHIFFIQGTLVFEGPLDILVQRRCNSGIDHVPTKDACLNFLAIWSASLRDRRLVWTQPLECAFSLLGKVRDKMTRVTRSSGFAVYHTPNSALWRSQFLHGISFSRDSSFSE